MCMCTHLHLCPGLSAGWRFDGFLGSYKQKVNVEEHSGFPAHVESTAASVLGKTIKLWGVATDSLCGSSAPHGVCVPGPCPELQTSLKGPTTELPASVPGHWSLAFPISPPVLNLGLKEHELMALQRALGWPPWCRWEKPIAERWDPSAPQPTYFSWS